MIDYKKYLDRFGFPLKKTPDHNIKHFFEKRVFLFSSFKRKFDICLKLPSFDIIEYYYEDNIFGKYYLDKIKTINFFNLFNLSINFKLLSIINFYLFKKKIINLKKDEVCFFGPYSSNYTHAINEYFLRLVYLSEKKIYKKIWLPSNLKKYLKSYTYKKTFSDLTLKFYPSDENLIFKNCNYLTHPNNRWLIRKNNKLVPKEFKKLSNIFRKKIYKNHRKTNNDEYKFILVSRDKALKRKLLNEKELFTKLKKYKFKLVFFENLSFENQINIARNCKIMIGYHGAGLSNLFFMRPKTLLIEIFNENYNQESLKLFSKSLNINYKSFKCKDNYSNLNGVCDVEEILNYIKVKLS